MSLTVFDTSIYGFLPYQLSRSSIQATFRLTREKHETSKRIVRYMFKVTVRGTTKPPLKQL